jgi:hypothetical protein
LILTQGRLFSQIGDAHYYCSSMSSPSDTTRSLSAEGHYHSNYNSCSLLRRSLARSLCSDFTAGLSCSPLPATRTLSIVLIFSPQKDGAAAGRPAACATAKGASGRRPWRHPRHMPQCPLPLGLGAVLHAVTTASTLPPILLIGRARLVESPHQGRN